MRKFVWLIIILIILFALIVVLFFKEKNNTTIDTCSAYTNNYYNDEFPLKILNINTSNNTLKQYYYTKPPDKVIAVWQNSIETLIALGVGDRIIAGIGAPSREYILPQYRSQYDNIPVKSLEYLDVESAMMMEPNFILGWYSTFTSKVLRDTEFWNSRNVNTYVAMSSTNFTGKHTLQDEYKYIMDLGLIFDKRDKAMEIVEVMQSEIDFIVSKTNCIDKNPRAMVIELIGRDVRVYGEDTLAGDIIKKLNGELIESQNINYSLEQLIKVDPDVIFLVVTESEYGNENMHLEKICSNKALKGMKCVKNNRVYTVPLYAVYTSGVRSYDGIKIISRGLYPELYE